MAADNEHRLVSKIIRDRSIVPALQKNINEHWFLDDENKRVWSFVRKHYNDYNEVPTAVVVKDHYPNYKILDVEDTIDYLIDTMVEFRRRKLTRDGLEEAFTEFKDSGHDSALISMEKTLTVVNEQGVLGTHEVDLAQNTQERYQDYLAIQNEQMLGLPTGFEKIDEATAGLQGGQLITLIAPPKTGKSQIALKIAINLHKQGYSPMFQSFEMTNREQQTRHDSIRANVSYSRLRTGKLLPEEEKRYIGMLNEMETLHPFHLVDAVNGLTVSALAAKIQQTNPEIVFIDGVYLMLDEVSGEMNTPKALTNITRSIKRLSLRIDKPILITTQTLLWKMKAGRVTADSIGYSSSFFQDSDVILGLEPYVDKGGNEEDKIRTLRIVASRNCPPTETNITWNWDTGCFHDEDEDRTCFFCTWKTIL